MSYAKLTEMKFVLQSLRKELNELKKADPTDENLAAVNSIEKRAKEITAAIRVYAKAHGITA